MCRPSNAERMLSGQHLASQRLASQELPEQEPEDELAEDDEPPPEQRRRSIGHPPTVPPDSLHRWLPQHKESSTCTSVLLPGMSSLPDPYCH